VRIRRLWSELPPADIALALALFAVKEAFVFTSTLMSGGASAINIACAAALTLPLAWRRRAPLPATAFIAAAIVVGDVASGWNGSVISFDSSIIAAYSSGAHARQRSAIAALMLLLGANLVDALGAPGNRTGNVALGVVVFSLVPWLVGQALRRERRRTAELSELTGQLEAQREQLASEAVSAERARIARELHDVLAHTISLIAVQADAAAKLLRHDPGRAREPLETIQSTSRGALAEMRQLVGLLRDDGAGAPTEPQPGVDDIERLVDEVRRSGVPVTFELTGPPRSLSAPLDLAAYRIVQEGLTNVRKHAANADACVSLRYRRDDLEIEVRDNGAASVESEGGGYGLVGIQERVSLLGGQLNAGRTAEGGFLLRARLPLAAPPR